MSAIICVSIYISVHHHLFPVSSLCPFPLSSCFLFSLTSPHISLSLPFFFELPSLLPHLSFLFFLSFLPSSCHPAFLRSLFTFPILRYKFTSEFSSLFITLWDNNANVTQPDIYQSLPWIFFHKSLLAFLVKKLNSLIQISKDKKLF